ncbi:hypothetical protein [Lewinella sp. W8]|uniref:hypothetical protein n=1 Tax=Lewinella sp. W8 TaxID=2528208 RepID=UPI001068C814|nr:hypothetical protein [Lewinella sp. W8]MTB50451.1 hypothetical protein [Lewinella sp. W8]
MKCYQLIVLLFLLAGVPLSGQSIWPGDVNNNGRVGAVDLLYWGIANGSTGPARSTQSTDWMAQPGGAAWSQSFPNGINYAFADCDGNGVVDETDFDDAIENNYGLEQGGEILPDGYANAEEGEAGPMLKLSSAVNLVEPGAVLDIDLSIVDNGVPVTDFYALALQISYTTGLLEGDDGPDFDFVEGAWFEGGDEAFQALYEDESGSGRAELGLTRTNQLSVPIEPGEMGSFNIIVEDIIVGLEREDFILRIDSVLLIGPDLTAIRTHTDSIVITIVPDTSKVTSVNSPEISRNADVNLFPNPVHRELFIDSAMDLKAVWLMTPLGQRRPLPVDYTTGDGTHRILLPRLRPGPYWIGLRGNDAVVVRKIIVAPPD